MSKNCHRDSPKKPVFEHLVKREELEGSLPLKRMKGALPVRIAGPAVSILILIGSSYAAPTIVHSSTIPEPGILALLGGGLVGLATLVRRHLSE